MKANQLKKIIQEAVREAVKEEVKDLVTSAVSNIVSFSFEDETGKKNVEGHRYSTGTSNQPRRDLKEMFSSDEDPITRMLNMTKQSMTPQDYKNIAGVSEQVTGLNEITQEFNSNITQTPSFTGPQPGIDISQLDFVGKAAAIYNKSIEKDKSRMGG